MSEEQKNMQEEGQEKEVHHVQPVSAENDVNTAEKEEAAMLVENIKAIKEIRLRIDGLNHIVTTPETGQPSREKASASSHLLMAKDWFGEVLEVNGERVKSKKDVNQPVDISEESDVSESIKVQVNKQEKGKPVVTVDANEIQSINHVRKDIEFILTKASIINILSGTVYEHYIFQHLKEVEFWTERELRRLKTAYKQNLMKAKQQPGMPKVPLGVGKPLLGNRKKKNVAPIKDLKIKKVEVEEIPKEPVESSIKEEQKEDGKKADS